MSREAPAFSLLITLMLVVSRPVSAQVSVTLAWDPPDGVVDPSYLVEWGSEPGSYVASAPVDRGVTTFAVGGLYPDRRYYFVVRTVDALGRRSAPSNEVSAVTPGAGLPGSDGGSRDNRPDATLTLRRAGSGTGTIASAPVGIDCGSTCATSLPRNTHVVLVATADAGSRFTGWQGSSCSGDGSCAFDLDGHTTITAAFETDGSSRSIARRYLAEGATSSFFDTRIALANPGARSASVSLQFLREDGVVIPHTAQVPALSSAHVDARQVAGLRGTAFSTTIDSNVPVVVDRTMTWRGPDGHAVGAHAESSVGGPSARWYLAEGATHAGFDLFYLLQNPSDVEVQARVRYLRPTGTPLEKTYRLPPASRTTIWVDHEVFDASGVTLLASTEVSAVIDVLSGPGIVVERAMYDSRDGVTFMAGHESAGVTAPATRWYFAEGATGPYFDLFLLVANPGSRAADVAVTYLLPDGTRVRRTHRVGPSQRYTIWVDQEGPLLADTAVSAIVESVNGVPIVAERSMWWPGDSRSWTEAHNSPGATQAGTRWAVADGEVATGTNTRSTYLLVANASEADARVRITLLPRAGQSAISRDFVVAAGSRFGLSVGDTFPGVNGQRFGALVESLGEAPVPIVVERAMYADAPGQPWASGTSVLATRLR